MNKRLVILFSCFLVVSIGYGVTLPVLTFYIERFALVEGTTSQIASLHVGILTGIFALMQFFFAPFWGKWSDRIGRRPLFIIGLGGYVVTNLLFGLGTNLLMLYIARILGGMLSAAVLPAAFAYVSDVTSAKDRGKGMALLASAVSLGLVMGPAIGALSSKLYLPFNYSFSYFSIDDFSVPFFAAAFLGLLALFSAMVWLKESLSVGELISNQDHEITEKGLKSLRRWKLVKGAFGKLLAMSFLSQFALTLFEGTFALHAQRLMKFGPTQMGLVFVVCGLVMAGAQASIVGRLITSVGEKSLLSIGFGFMGIGLILLMTTQSLILILIFVAIFALGMALLTPSLATLVSKRAGKHSGTASGLQSAVNSLGQAIGPFVGGFLLAWYVHIPYLFTAILLLTAAFIIGRKTWLLKRLV
jgi:DHA1 family multidrug resistance protein-like MFS transporter